MSNTVSGLNPRDVAAVQRIRRRGNVIVEASPELLTMDSFSEPLHVKIEDLGDGTHLLTFQRSYDLYLLAQQADRAERILAALREPSEAIDAAACEALPYGISIAPGIRTAVAAAEREVDA